MTETRRRGFPPHAGRDFARTWAVAHGSAWVLASDLLEPPGIFAAYSKFQIITRAMERCGIAPERKPYNDKTYLYRLSPETVKELTYG